MDTTTDVAVRVVVPNTFPAALGGAVVEERRRRRGVVRRRSRLLSSPIFELWGSMIQETGRDLLSLVNDLSHQIAEESTDVVRANWQSLISYHRQVEYEVIDKVEMIRLALRI